MVSIPKIKNSKYPEWLRASGPRLKPCALCLIPVSGDLDGFQVLISYTCFVMAWMDFRYFFRYGN